MTCALKKKMRVALLVAAAGFAVAVQAQPVFRSAASAALSTTPSFRSAASAAVAPQAAFRAASSAATNTSSLAIGLPPGTAQNDVLIAAVGVRPSSATIAPPSGWTLVRRVNNTVGQTNSLAVYRKVAGGSEPSSFTWDVTGATYATGGIQAFSNVDTANPIDVESGQATAYGLAHATPSITTTVANALVVTAHTFATSTTWTAPTGMTEAFDASTSRSRPERGSRSPRATCCTRQPVRRAPKARAPPGARTTRTLGLRTSLRYARPRRRR